MLAPTPGYGTARAQAELQLNQIRVILSEWFDIGATSSRAGHISSRSRWRIGDRES
jgi:hypothetical protein